MSVEKGREAEDLAISFLQEDGFVIKEKNLYISHKEIDIVALKDGVVHFVEVKSGSGFEPIFNITPSKLRHLTYAIESYMKKFKNTLPYQLDVLIIKDGNIEFIENVTAM
ncbi:MAG: YraN family protein [Campylobacterales bacterium]